MSTAGELAADGYANPEDVDKVWRIAIGAPLGPFQIYDGIGLATPYNILSHGDERDRHIASWLKDNYIDAGKLGVATGEGFYRYTNDK
jgi:3-hydroxyacyl-CoA dehydrogenase